MFKTIKFTLLCSVMATVVACASKETNENADKYIDSAMLTNNIREKLIDKLGPQQAGAIKVKAYRDEVQLTGLVNNVITQQKAGEIAASVGQVRHIRNDLLIK